MLRTFWFTPMGFKKQCWTTFLTLTFFYDVTVVFSDYKLHWTELNWVVTIKNVISSIREGFNNNKNIFSWNFPWRGTSPPRPPPVENNYFVSNNFSNFGFVVLSPWNTFCMIPVIPSSHFGWVRAFSLAAILKST